MPKRAQRDAVVVDALVSVAGDEEVVLARGDRRAQQPPLRRVQILRLVDEHVVVRLDDRGIEIARGSRGKLEKRPLAGSLERGLEGLDRAPHLGAITAREAYAATGTRGREVLVPGLDVRARESPAPIPGRGTPSRSGKPSSSMTSCQRSSTLAPDQDADVRHLLGVSDRPASKRVDGRHVDALEQLRAAESAQAVDEVVS